MIFHDWLATDIIPDPFVWYQYQPGASGHHIIYDSVGGLKNLVGNIADAPVLTENVLNGHPAWYFDGTVEPLTYTGAVTLKHVFVMASQEDAVFATHQGLLTGEAAGDVLVGDNGTNKFFDLSATYTYDYFKSGTEYANNNQLAPISGAFALLEASSVGGFGLDGIQIGQQKADVTRRWQGHFVEMIAFDRVLTEREIRRVRLYFNIKFGEWQNGLPLYFPSADIVPTPGPSRFLDVAPDYGSITDSWEYEDAVKDHNEVADAPPMFWEYAYPAVDKAQLPIFNEFWNQARLVNSFLFKDPEHYVWTNVRIDDYNRNHEAHKRWRHDVAFRLVGYNSVGTHEYFDETAPSIPSGLAAAATGSSTVELTWEASSDT